MIYLFHGADDYSMREAVRDIRHRLNGGAGADDGNTTVLDGRALSPDELIAHATAVPFLAEYRLVIVDGLVGAAGQAKGGRRKKGSADDPLEPWRQAAARLGNPATMPETTTLILLEGVLRRDNPAFTVFAPIAQTREFSPLASGDVAAWIETATRRLDVQLAPRAIAALAQMVGPDLWTLDSEIKKLGAYADGEVIDEEMVERVASVAREARIWDLTDGIVEGDAGKALTAMRRLMADGEAPQLMLFMIARQFRQLIIAKDMRDARARPEEIISASGINKYRLNATLAVASRYSWPQLHEAYRRILEADLDVKRGLQTDEASLQVLIHELAMLAPAARAGRPAAPRR